MIPRTPVVIKRKPITILTKKGYKKSGGYFVFKPFGSPPNVKLKDHNARILFCPYCGEWTWWKQFRDEKGKWYCQGGCGWAHTDEYYVKKANEGLWFEAVPLSDLRKVDLSITRPQRRR